MKRSITQSLIISLTLLLFICLGINGFLKLSISHDKIQKDALSLFSQLNDQLNKGKDIQTVIDANNSLASRIVYVIDTTNNSVIASSIDSNETNSIQLSNDELTKIVNSDSIEHIYINNQKYCASGLSIGNYSYIYLYPSIFVFQSIVADLSIYAMFSLLLIGFAVLIVHYYIDTYLCKPIDNLHMQLFNYQKGVDFKPFKIKKSSELSQLSNHIDEILQGKKDNYNKILSALEYSKLRLGIVESSQDNNGVVTSRVKEMLHLSDQIKPNAVIAILEELMQQHPINNDHIYPYYVDLQCYYLKIDTYRYDNSVMYIIVDMTDTVLTQRRIEHERDIDVLTSLYNRRGFYDKLDELFANPSLLKYSAMILIDMDRLKYINDTYGHTMGDNYIEALANIVTYLPYANYLPCRLGGDEFAIFIYGYDSLDELTESINLLKAKGSTQLANLPAGPVEFSIGFAIVPDDGNDFRELMRIADERMYMNKQMKRSGIK